MKNLGALMPSSSRAAQIMKRIVTLSLKAACTCPSLMFGDVIKPLRKTSAFSPRMQSLVADRFDPVQFDTRENDNI